TVSPRPFVETGTGWFVDGRGWLVTNAHVVDPAYRPRPWVTHELKKKAIEQACVEPVLRERGLMRGLRPDVEEQIRRQASDQALATAKVATFPKITVMLSNGTKLAAEVKKFSPPPVLDNNGRPLPDYGRDLALLRVKDGVYPAIGLSRRDVQIGDPVHILGFPGVVLEHELLNQSATLEASVTNGAVSGVKQDAIGQELVQTDAPAAHGNSGGPAITDDKRLLADAEEKVKHPPPRPFPWAWATVGVTLLSLGAYGAMWGKRWWKNRYRVQPTQVIGFIERGLSPVLLDVRTKTDYE